MGVLHCRCWKPLEKLESSHRDFFLVFAHVEAPSGLWAELDGGRLAELGQNELFRRRTLVFKRFEPTINCKRITNPAEQKHSSILVTGIPLNSKVVMQMHRGDRSKVSPVTSNWAN